MNAIAIFFIRLYQLTLSRLLPGACRFYPSCSHYAIECFREMPFHLAAMKSLYRILRCNPWNEGYFDPLRVTRAGESLEIINKKDCSCRKTANR